MADIGILDIAFFAISQRDPVQAFNDGNPLRNRQLLHMLGKLVGTDRLFSQGFAFGQHGICLVCIEFERFQQDFSDHVAFNVHIDPIGQGSLDK